MYWDCQDHIEMIAVRSGCYKCHGRTFIHFCCRRTPADRGPRRRRLTFLWRCAAPCAPTTSAFDGYYFLLSVPMLLLWCDVFCGGAVRRRKDIHSGRNRLAEAGPSESEKIATACRAADQIVDDEEAGHSDDPACRACASATTAGRYRCGLWQNNCSGSVGGNRRECDRCCDRRVHIFFHNDTTIADTGSPYLFGFAASYALGYS